MIPFQEEETDDGVDQLGPAEFSQKLPSVYERCDELRAECAPKGFYMLKLKDVGW